MQNSLHLKVAGDNLNLVSDEAQTKPTIETVLERINALGQEFRSEITTLRSEFTALREEMHTFREKVEISLDRIESMTNQTRAEMLTLRADFREFCVQLKQPA
jgi:prefoldin subunit 5